MRNIKHYKINIILIIIFFINLNLLFCSKVELSEKFALELEIKKAWIKAHEQELNQNKISFEYDDKKGFFCKAKMFLFKNDIVFKIPKKYVLCVCKNKLHYFIK